MEMIARVPLKTLGPRQSRSVKLYGINIHGRQTSLTNHHATFIIIYKKFNTILNMDVYPVSSFYFLMEYLCLVVLALIHRIWVLWTNDCSIYILPR